MKSVFIYIIKQSIVTEIESKYNYTKVPITYDNESITLTIISQQPDNFIVIFTNAKAEGGKAIDISNGITRMYNILSCLGSGILSGFQRVDYIGLGIHSGDWGIRSDDLPGRDIFLTELNNHDGEKDATKIFIQKVRGEHCTTNGHVVIKLFSHDLDYNIWKYINRQSELFLKNSFQQWVFNIRTAERLKTLLYSFRVILSSLKMAVQSKEESILDVHIWQNMKNQLKEIINGKLAKEGNEPGLGFKDYLPDPTQLPGHFKEVNDYLDNDGQNGIELITTCKVIEGEMSNILQGLRQQQESLRVNDGRA